MGIERTQSYLAAFLAVGLGLSSAAAAAPDWNGVWVRVGGLNFDPNVRFGVAEHPKLTPEYEAAYEKGLAKKKAGGTPYDPTANCAPPGMPRMMIAVYPLEIFERPGEVAIEAEWDGEVRHIYTGAGANHSQVDTFGPTYAGDSVGHWEGKDLLVDTVGLRGDMTIAENGLRASDALHISERFHQVDTNTLTDTITLTDPKALAEPWTVTRTYKRAPPDQHLLEYICTENNRNPIVGGQTGFVLEHADGSTKVVAP